MNKEYIKDGEINDFDICVYNSGDYARIVTKDGHRVRVLCIDHEGTHPIVAIVNMGHTETVMKYTLTGQSVVFPPLRIMTIKPPKDGDICVLWNDTEDDVIICNKTERTKHHFEAYKYHVRLDDFDIDAWVKSFK